MEHEENIRKKVYEAVLARGEAGKERFYEELRAEGIAPTPADEPGHLYAPNPVVVPRSVVDAMVRDLNVFADWKRDRIRSHQELLEAAPPLVRDDFASTGVAAQLFLALKRRHPFACLDAYLVETPQGLDRAYLEWQTFPAYVCLGMKALAATGRAFPEIAAHGAHLTTAGSDDLEPLAKRMAALFLEGIDDARTGVVLDFEPARQETRREFYAVQALTGGAAHGFGVIDPREIRYLDGTPHYRRDGRWVAIEKAISRLVAGDIERGLAPALRGSEREDVQRFFKDGDNVDWLVHPLHFHYGSKTDFPDFHAAGLSLGLPRCELVSLETIAQARSRGSERMLGMVQKPADGCGGAGVVLDPLVDELLPGAVLQQVIQPAACHQTLYGPHVPEVRVMGIPRADGGLDSPIVFTRVKSADVFRSNAGVTARAGIPGTGEGYAVIAG